MGEVSSSQSPPRLMLAAKLMVQLQVHPLKALIDSGAEQNFIDALLAQRLNLNSEPLLQSLQVTALTGQRLPNITHINKPVLPTLSGNHSQTIQLYVFQAPLTPLVLGYP